MIIEDSLLLSNSDGRSITRGCSTLQMVSAVAVSLARISRRCNYRWRWLWLCGWVMELNQQSVSCRYLSNFWSLRIDLDIPPPRQKWSDGYRKKKTWKQIWSWKFRFVEATWFLCWISRVSVSWFHALSHWITGFSVNGCMNLNKHAPTCGCVLVR